MGQGDALVRERRVLPWVRLRSGDLFGPQCQLIVQHVMLGPG